MSRVRATAFEVVHRIGREHTTEGIVSELRRAGGQFNYENFCITGLPTSPSEGFRECTLVSGWPAEWSQRYAEHGYIAVDPAIHKIRSTTLPFTWDEVAYDRRDLRAARVMNESPSFGLVEGLVVPIHTIRGFHAGVCFSTSSRLRLTEETRAALHLIAIYAHARASAIVGERGGRKPRRPPQLSRREIECLKWTAAGKTCWETSVILRISQKTVEHHVASGMRKLGAVNRTQAVAEAMRQNLIQ